MRKRAFSPGASTRWGRRCRPGTQAHPRSDVAQWTHHAAVMGPAFAATWRAVAGFARTLCPSAPNTLACRRGLQCARGAVSAQSTEPLSHLASRPQIKRHVFTIPRHQNHLHQPRPRAVGGSRRRRRDSVRGQRARPARPPDADGARARRDPAQARLSCAGRQAARRGHRAHHAARLVAEIRGPLHPADPDRRPGLVPDRRFPGARSAARLCALRRDAAEGRRRIPARCSARAISR